MGLRNLNMTSTEPLRGYPLGVIRTRTVNEKRRLVEGNLWVMQEQECARTRFERASFTSKGFILTMDIISIGLFIVPEFCRECLDYLTKEEKISQGK